MSNAEKSITVDAGVEASKRGLDLSTQLNAEQIGALEKKAAALPVEVQDAMMQPGLSIVEAYVLRQIKREANNALASRLRPVWIMQLVLYVPTLVSADKTVQENSARAVAGVADEIDSPKEVNKVLIAVKTKLLGASMDVQRTVNAINVMCKIFNVSPDSLLK